MVSVAGNNKDTIEIPLKQPCAIDRGTVAQITGGTVSPLKYITRTVFDKNQKIGTYFLIPL